MKCLVEARVPVKDFIAFFTADGVTQSDPVNRVQIWFLSAWNSAK